MTLDEFNAAPADAATQLITHWCAAPNWATDVCNRRPFSDVNALSVTCRELWQQASTADCLAAFAAHPVIGDVALLRTKYASQANKEQGQVLSASDEVLDTLASQNLVYKERHGFTFIVFATGKSAQQMLDLLNHRINNSRDQEIHNAANEQLKIMHLRLTQSFTQTSTHPI